MTRKAKQLKIKDIKTSSIKTKDLHTSNNKKVNNIHKRRYIRLERLLLILCFTFITLFTIGCHSSYLIKVPIKWIILALIIICIGILVFLIIKYMKSNEHVGFKKLRLFFDFIVYLYMMGCIVFLFLLYGPDYGFRDWLITTGMGTMNHQYICRIFYSDKEITESLARNYIVEPDGETDMSLINKNATQTFSSPFEEDIYKDHTDSERYRIIKFKVNGQKAYLGVIYNPTDVSVAVTKSLHYSGEYVVSMAKRTNAYLAINGGGFDDIDYKGTGGEPLGVTIVNGKILTDYSYGGSQGVIGLTKDGILFLSKSKSASDCMNLGMYNAVTGGPLLIVNGNAAFTSGNGGWGYAARTAIGQRQDGVILFLVVESNETRTNGASMVDLTKIMKNYGAINAAALDGGTSTIMVENGEALSTPINASFEHKTRPIADAFIAVDPTKED